MGWVCKLVVRVGSGEEKVTHLHICVIQLHSTAATLSGNSLRQTVHIHRASVNPVSYTHLTLPTKRIV